MATKLVKLVKTDEEDKKKYIATFSIGDKIKKVKFGAKGYEDYTIHKDKDRRELYRNRHKGDNLSDPTSPGALSYYILWGDSTSIRTNKEEYKRRFNLS